MRLNTKLSCSIRSYIVMKWEEFRTPFIVAIVVGFLAHFAVFSNKLTNPDDIYYLFGKGASASSGRWGLDLMAFVFPNFSMPWLYGIITLFLIILSGCVMIRILDIQNSILRAILLSILVAYPSLTSLYTYMFTSSSYGLAFLLSVLSVHQLICRRSFWKIFAVPMLIFSMSIYQPYLAVAASLMIIYLIKQIMSKETTCRKIWLQGVSFLGFLIVSLALYYLSMHMVFALFKIQLNSYASENLSLDVKTLMFRLVDTYYTSIYFFTRGYHGIICTAWIRILHVVLLFAGGLMIAMQTFRSFNLGKAILLFICVAIFPLSVNCIYMIASPESIHTLVVFSFVTIYFFLAVILENFMHDSLGKYEKRSKVHPHILSSLVGLSLIVIVIFNVFLANEVYLKVQLSYENSYNFYSNLSGLIANNPDYDKNTKIAIIGNVEDNATISPVAFESEFEAISIMGSNGIQIKSYAQETFLKYFLGLNIPFANKEEIRKIMESTSFADMASYPYYGSIQKIDDFLVIKLSD